MNGVVRVLPGSRDLLALAAARPLRYPGLLESAARGNARARHDILFAFPESALRLDAGAAVDPRAGARFLDALDRDWRAVKLPRVDDGLPFHGGWLLYLGYELAGSIEPSLRLPAARGPLPTALALRCPAAIIVDHPADRTVLVAEAGREELVRAMLADLEVAHADPPALPAVLEVSEESPARFLAGVARVHAHLGAGDVFQVNLSRGWQARFAAAPAPASLHGALRRANPAPFAGLLQVEDWAIASSSPERLVEVRGGVVQARPIAGTRPRSAGDDDVARVRELAAHPKERAEHVMLIDLERNDLGRVCVAGSVRVDELMVVESYTHVHHLVSNVRGRLREDISPVDVVRAVFPGGTITGCPKVRCMQIIADLEQDGRGAYTGSLGYLDRNGDLDLNILIRSLVQHGASVAFRAGAGIVTDSVDERELDETRAKARGLLRALGCPG